MISLKSENIGSLFISVSHSRFAFSFHCIFSIWIPFYIMGNHSFQSKAESMIWTGMIMVHANIVASLWPLSGKVSDFKISSEAPVRTSPDPQWDSGLPHRDSPADLHFLTDSQDSAWGFLTGISTIGLTLDLFSFLPRKVSKRISVYFRDSMTAGQLAVLPVGAYAGLPLRLRRSNYLLFPHHLGLRDILLTLMWMTSRFRRGSLYLKPDLRGRFLFGWFLFDLSQGKEGSRVLTFDKRRGEMKCPGQDMRYWKPGDIFNAKCPKCGGTVEFFKDEVPSEMPLWPCGYQPQAGFWMRRMVSLCGAVYRGGSRGGEGQAESGTRKLSPGEDLSGDEKIFWQRPETNQPRPEGGALMQSGS